MTELNFDGKQIFFFGDSNTVYVNGDETKRWTRLLCNEKNGIERNFGSNGQTLQHTGDNFLQKENFPFFSNDNCKYIFIAEGTNDVRYNNMFTVENFKSQLVENINYAVNVKGWNYSNIVLPSINYMGNFDNGSLEKHLIYNEAIRQICEDFNCIFIDIYNIFKNLFNRDSFLKDDLLHLNDLGNRKMADIYLSADYTPYSGESTNPINTFKINKKFRIV